MESGAAHRGEPGIIHSLSAAVAHSHSLVRCPDERTGMVVSPRCSGPLHLEGNRTDNQNPACAVANDKFLTNQPGFYGIAEANVVGDQQIDTWRLNGPRHGIKLVV